MLIYPSEDQEFEQLRAVSRGDAVHEPHDAAGRLGIRRPYGPTGHMQNGAGYSGAREQAIYIIGLPLEIYARGASVQPCMRAVPGRAFNGIVEQIYSSGPKIFVQFGLTFDGDEVHCWPT